MKRLGSKLWLIAVTALVTSVAVAFWAPALRRTGGRWPAPLDDVYIHFDFARSAALGRPFQWIPGNGYSSGATSLTYPLVLAPAWLLGLRGDRLGVFAALLAIVCVVDLCRSLRAILAAQRAPQWLRWLAPALVVAVPLLDWSLFSGMETALFAAILGRALRATSDASSSPPAHRPRAQLRAGVWAALLIATRPESAPLALLLGVAAAYDARSLSIVASLARSIAPSLLFLALQALANRALTGEWSAAGAVRKLVGSNPYITPAEAAVEVLKNLVILRNQALGAALGGPRVSWLLPLLALAALGSPRARRLALPLFVGAYTSLALASLNATARFQNLRYAAPTLLMLIAAAILGAGVIARRRGPAQLVAAMALLAAAIAPAPAFERQIDHFARASANIAEQQIEVGRRLAARAPRPRSVLLGDAGAIPYFSEIGAIDGLGLGGYKGLPFARASVHGVPAVVELIERLPERERPDVFALYPSWWVGLADVFGKPAFSVRIDDNVICGAPEKVVYDADWSALAPAGERRASAIDELDTADLVDERAHHYEAPTPQGGWVIGAVLADPEGRARFDAGRIVPEGRRESFVVRDGVPPGPATLALRTDGGGEDVLRIEIERAGKIVQSRDVVMPPRPADRWAELRSQLVDIRSGDRVTLYAVRGALRSFHLWLLRE